MPIIEIHDATDERLRLYSGMTDAQLREIATPKSGERRDLFTQYVNGLFVAESKNVIWRALDGGCPVVSVFMEECWLEHEMPLVERVLALDPDLPVYVVDHETFRKVTGYQLTRGALAAFERKPLPSVAELLADATRVAIIEDVTNYTNIGAIFRSAAALGVDAVLITPNCHDPLYRRASRVSMGTVFQVPWTRIGDDADWAADGIAELRSLGFTTVALALKEDSISLRDPRLKECERLAMVLGTEGEGLRDATIAACDHTVIIPMQHDVDSLNVAAASAVTFWELCDK